MTDTTTIQNQIKRHDDRSAACQQLAPNGKGFVVVDGEVTYWDETEAGCPQPTEAEIDAKATEIANARPMANLRRLRDKKLAETDWMATGDRTITAEQAAYRQALRDLPANTNEADLGWDDKGRVTGIVWPTEPE